MIFLNPLTTQIRKNKYISIFLMLILHTQSIFLKKMFFKCALGLKLKSNHVHKIQTKNNIYLFGHFIHWMVTYSLTFAFPLCLAVSWDIGEWSECSRKCGPGSQLRQVICCQVTRVHANRTETAVAVAPERCSSSERPATQSTCQLKICSQWEIRSDWSPVREKNVFMELLHNLWAHLHSSMTK